jgi:hypothetical protein
MANKYAQESLVAQEAAKRLKACESKVAYETPLAAACKGTDVYHCPYCGKFHRTGAFQRLVDQLSK